MNAVINDNATDRCLMCEAAFVPRWHWHSVKRLECRAARGFADADCCPGIPAREFVASCRTPSSLGRSKGTPKLSGAQAAKSLRHDASTVAAYGGAEIARHRPARIVADCRAGKKQFRLRRCALARCCQRATRWSAPIIDCGILHGMCAAQRSCRGQVCLYRPPRQRRFRPAPLGESVRYGQIDLSR